MRNLRKRTLHLIDTKIEVVYYGSNASCEAESLRETRLFLQVEINKAIYTPSKVEMERFRTSTH